MKTSVAPVNVQEEAPAPKGPQTTRHISPAQPPQDLHSGRTSRVGPVRFPLAKATWPGQLPAPPGHARAWSGHDGTGWPLGSRLIPSSSTVAGLPSSYLDSYTPGMPLPSRSQYCQLAECGPPTRDPPGTR